MDNTSRRPPCSFPQRVPRTPSSAASTSPVFRRLPLAFVLVLGAFLAGCGLQDVRVDGTVEIEGVTAVYDGTAQQPEITMNPPGAWIGASITVTPDGGAPLPAGTWPVDAGVYQVVAEAGPSVEGGRAEVTLTIAPRPVPIAPEAGQGKLVGQADPAAFAYEATNLVGDDALVGALAREAGETVGSYAFELGTLSGGSNYALALVEDAPSFAIAVSELGDGAITVASASVVYDGTPHEVLVAFDPPAAGVGAVVTYGDLAPGALPVDAGVYAVSVVPGPGYDGSASGTLTIEQRAVVVTPASDQGKTYGEDDPTSFAYEATGLAAGDALEGALTRAPGTEVGSYAYAIGSLTGGSNYVLELAADAPSFAIAARPLELSDFLADAKVYDGTTDVPGARFADDRLEGDVFAVDFTAAFAAAEVGDAVSVAFSDFALSGADAGNYVVATTSGAAAAAIAPRSVTVAPEAGQGKLFGADDPAFVYTASNLVGGDVLVGALARAPGEDVGAYAFEVVPAAGAPNYALELAEDAPSFTIAVSELGDGAITVSSATVVYDGTAQSVVVGFEPAAAGTGAVVTYGDLAPGELPVDAGVYAVSVVPGDGYSGSGSGTLTIDPRSLTPSGFVASGKTYDGTNVVPAGASFDDDRLGDDDLVFSFDVAFASEDAGASVAVDFTGIAISGGSDAGNYVVSATSGSTTAAIAPRSLELSGFAADAKVYDGTTDVPGARFADDRLEGDVFAVDFTAAFAAAEVGDAVSVAFSGFALSGADAGNYAVVPTSGAAAAAITPRPLALVDASAADKVYDGDSAAMVTGLLEVGSLADRGLLDGDRDGVAFGGAFRSSAVGADVPVDVALSGPRASNYALDALELAASITPRALTVVAEDRERVYGVANPSPTYTLSGFVDGEDATSAGVSGSPDLRIAAELESLPGDYGIVVDGVGSLAAANYGFSLADAVDGTLTIVKRSVSFDVTNRGASLTDADLTYDSMPLAIVVAIVDDLGQRVDPVPANAPIAYDVAAPRYRIDATGQVLDPAPSTAAITDAGMYWVTIQAAFGVDDPRYDVTPATNVEVFVERRALTVGAQAVDKPYGATDPSFAPVVLGGLPLAQNDAFTDGALGRTAGESVGTYDLLAGELGIASIDILRGPGRSTLDNYDLSFGAFEITAAPLTVAATPTEKVYGDALADGAGYTGFTATGLQFEDAIESVSVAFTDGFAATAPVGSYEGAIALSAATGSAFAAGNYAITYAPGDLEVTPAPLTVTASDRTKAYGDALEGSAGYAAFTATGLRNEETIDSVSVAYADGEAGTDAVDAYLEAILVSAATGGTFTASNYAIAYEAGDLEVTPRALTITATDQTKEYDRTLEAGPGYVGFTTSGLQNGETVGSVTVAYTDGAAPDDAADTLGAIQLSAATGGTFAASNYAIAYIDGSLTVVQRPIAFDVANYDFLAGDVRVFMRDGQSPIGYSIASDPAGVNAYVVSYRRTHAADGTPIPAAQQPVSTIQQPGTYRVTIRVADANYVDDGDLDGTVGDLSVRTVWVNDATHVAFTDDSDDGALVGGFGALTLELRGGDGLRRAGPAPIDVRVVSGAVEVLVAPADAGWIGLGVDAPAPGFADAVDLTIPAFASTVDLYALAEVLSTVAPRLTATVQTPFDADLEGDTAPFTPRAALEFAAGAGWSPAWQMGAEAMSGEVLVRLVGEFGLLVRAPDDLRVDLTADDPDLEFLTGSIGVKGFVDEPYVVIPRYDSTAWFAVGSSRVGPATIRGAHAPGFVGVASTEQALTVTDRPVVRDVSPLVTLRGSTNTTITVHGDGFQAGTWTPSQVVFGGTGVTVDSVAFVSATQLDLAVSVAADASLGARSLTVTNADGGAGVLESAFTVLSNPHVSGVSPALGSQGTTVQVTVSGSGFADASLEFGQGIAVTMVSSSATQMVADVAIAPDAVTGVRTATLRNADDQTAGFDFTVLFGLSVTGTEQLGTGFVGQWVEMRFTGTGLSDATPSSDAWSDAYVHARSQTSLAARVQIAGTGSTGITMTTASGSVPAGDTRRVVAIDQGTRELRSGMLSGFSIELAAGATIYIDVEGVDTPYVDGEGVLGGGGHPEWTAQDPHFRLFAPGSGGLVLEDADSGVGSNARGAYTVGEAGAYVLELSNEAYELGTLRYTISVQEGLSVHAAETQQFGSGLAASTSVAQWVEMRFYGTGLSDATPQSAAWSSVAVQSRTPTMLVAYVRARYSGSTAITMMAGGVSVPAGTFRGTDFVAAGGRGLDAGESMAYVGVFSLQAGTTYYFDLEGADTPFTTRTWPGMEVEVRFGDAETGPIVAGPVTGGGVGRNVAFSYTPTTTGNHYLFIRSPGLEPAEYATLEYKVSR